MNPNLKPTESNDALSSSIKPSGDTKAGQMDASIAFDLLENPQNWPDNPILQKELAELLEIHLAMGAHADELALTLTRSKALKRFTAGWLLSAAAIVIAILPAAYAVASIRETRRMQARGAVLEVELQKQIQAKLWSDFFNDSLDLLKQIKNPVKYCAPSTEDRSFEVEQARKLYAVGRSLSLNGMDAPGVSETSLDMQNWLTEVSANDTCMTLERSHELLTLAYEMDLESKINKLNLKLREFYS